MTDIDVPDWVTEKVLSGYLRDWPDCNESTKAALTKIMRDSLRAALSAWVVHRGATYFDSRDSSLPTQVDWNHPEPGAKENVYTLRQEKPE